MCLLKCENFSFPNRNHRKSQEDLHYIKSSIRDSLKMWEEHINNIKFQESNEINADMMMSFGRRDHGDGSSFDGKGGILGNFLNFTYNSEKQY